MPSFAPGPSSVPEQRLPQSMPRAQLILLRGIPGPHQIPQRLMGRIRHPHRRQVTRAIAASPFLGVASIRLHAVAGLHGYQRRRDHLAAHAQRCHLPVHRVPGRPRLVADPQLLKRAELLDQPPDRFTPGSESRPATGPLRSVLPRRPRSSPHGDQQGLVQERRLENACPVGRECFQEPG